MTGKDHIGQEVNIGDWCAITQNNTVYVGKIVSLSEKGNPTICRNSIEEWCRGSKAWNNANWKVRKQLVNSKFPNNPGNGYVRLLSYCRDGKFVKIEPTQKMKVEYDFKPPQKTP